MATRLVIVTALVLLALAGGGVAWWWFHRRNNKKEGLITWGCPKGKQWGWGIEGTGKCCDAGNKNCVGAIQVSSDGKDFDCPPGKSWGWGANKGKCCDRGTNNNCVGATIEQEVRNQTYDNSSDASLAERNLARDPVTGDIISAKTLREREKKRRRDAKKKGKDYEAEGAKVVSSGKCKGMTKPASCAVGYSAKCQQNGSSYAFRCCTKSDLIGGYVCDSATDSRQVAAGSISGGTVPTRVDSNKCPPGTNKKDKDCYVFDQGKYVAWYNRFYVGRMGADKGYGCPPGTTGSYKFVDGSTDAKKCQVTDENKYLAWKKSMTPAPTTPAPTTAAPVTIDPNLKVTFYSDADFGGKQDSRGPGDQGDLDFANDSISSVKVPKGLKVTLYQKPGFQGKALTLTAGDHWNLKHWAFDDWQDDWGGDYKEGQWYGKDVCGGPSNTHCWNDTASSYKVELA